ncbi:MAG TPA: hypothetical protein EYQ27_21290 [Gemmatimonadetes bacterium]|nr:hypothetical protein [Gemmatimonadota bacterium]
MRSTAPRLTWLGPQRLIVLALLLGPAACDIPGFDGPQVQGPPPGGTTGGGAGSAPPGDADPPASGPFS